MKLPTLTPAARTRIYAVGLAILGLLAAYGVIDVLRVGDWTALIVALLGAGPVGTAVANRPTLSQTERDEHAALTQASHALVRLVGSEAPAEEIAAATDRLAGVLGPPR